MARTKSEDNVSKLTTEECKQSGRELYQKYIQQNQEVTDFQIVSTIRYDPNISKVKPKAVDDITAENFFLLPEHINRLQFTIEFFTRNEETTLVFEEKTILDQLVTSIKDNSHPVDTPLRIRLLVGLDGQVTLEFFETIERPNLLRGLDDDIPEDEIWDIYVDSETILMSPFTSFKTTHRSHYNAAREKCLPGARVGKEEVILGNVRGELMEGSITNIAVHKDGKWVTPELSSGCLCGVTRSFLLMNMYIKEGKLELKDVNIGDEVLLFNGVAGVVRGQVKAIV
ncbi:Aminodeoxychorismate lyase [Yamadazyma tenuis]|uniref:D-aminoacid aminotransferase-like PLP-dependent enzyme n=1 Tax=Candida tenuis (strain ATCC 10573 / BCRC 21748 / CBS 615 / JCM 9827 / NBRC 10315 / NRRL Y-1498 / VKM Y-70) TaxID=590646 RepID=G3AXL0_CANTC|nr:uncharacterized protein CANTEDRAFT_101096 [Yamadazyma tenuis ATCC 10573]EGV66412.1 hypothetical protein CANTEDRAFT_101096 [Yamadazyma tenuis ATCC 10573]WEJ95475.1 Aminodeoxychorismate lyase [Yamadazyma tenuis]